MMDKIFTSLMLGLLFVTVQLDAQTTPTFSIDPQSTSAQLNDIIEVDIVVSDFTDIVSTQYAVKWDSTILELVEVANINDTDFPTLSSGISSNQSSPNIPKGQVNVLWVDPTVSGVSVPDGTMRFTLRLEAIECGDADIFFDDFNENVSIEIISSVGFEEVGLTPENGTASVTGTGCGNQTPDLTLDIADATVESGENFCLEVSVEDFTNLTDVELSINYNANMLSFASVSNLNLAGLSQGNFDTATDGEITLDWSNASATSVADGTVIFELCFQALVAGNTDVTFSGTPLAISVTDGDGMDIGFTGNNSVVTISPISTGGDLLVDIESTNVNEGDNFCISVTTDNYDDVVGMAFTLNYDPSQLEFVEVTNLNPDIPGFSAASNIGTPPSIADGFITVNYFNQSLSGTTLANGAVLFDICFNAISDGTSSINMTSDITQIEFSDSNQDVIPSDDDPGIINVMGTGGNTDLIVDIENANVMEGDNFCVSVTTDNYMDVVGMAFTLNYNPGQLEFVEVTNLNSNISGFALSNIGTPPNIADGFITVNYFNQQLQGTDLPNGAVLFDICFEAISEGNSSITMTSDITVVEFSDSNQDIIPSDDDPGSITVEPSIVITDLFLEVEDATVDPGENFCVPVTTLNFNDVVGMAFTMNYDANQLEFVEVTNLNPNMDGFTMANFGTPPDIDDGFITVNYFNNNLAPTTLPDDAVLFEVCFTVTGSGTSSDITITSDITQIEFSDSNQEIIDFSSEEGTIDITGDILDLFLTVEDVTVPTDESFCVEITALNFEDVVGMAFTMNYDPSHLQFQQVTNLNPDLDGFMTSNFGTPPNIAEGFITVNYFNNNLAPTTLPDDAVLFELCFQPLGADGSCSDITFSSDITQIEFSDSNQEIIPFFSEEGTVCLDDATPGVVEINIGNANVDLNTDFCVPVTADNFVDVATMEYTIVYDANELELTGVNNLTGSLPGFTLNSSIDNSTPGIITVEWTGTAGVTLPNNTDLFELCFEAIGTEGQCSDIAINSTVIPINLLDGNGGPLTLDASEGTVCINPPFDGFLLTIPDEVVEPGENFCVPVTVLNFIDVVGFAFTINYDETQLQFNQVQNLNPDVPSFSEDTHIAWPPDVASGHITVSYFNNNLAPTDLPNGDVLFEICFTAIGDDGDVSDIEFTSDITPIEISDSNQEIIPFNSEAGTITISEIQPPQIVDADVTDIPCQGEQSGSITVDVQGGTGGPYNYTWENEDGDDAGNTATIENLSQGTYFLTVTDANSNLTVTASYTIFAPSSAIDIAGGVTSPTCQGGCNGTIFTNVSGGTPGYTYAWGNGLSSETGSSVNNLCAGTYPVTVTDANGCTEVRSFIVPDGVGTPINIDSNVGDVSCNGDNDGTISLIVSGFTGGVTYVWCEGLSGSSSQNNLAAGDYCVTVIDNIGCQNTTTITVEEPDPIVLDPEVTEVACTGEASGAITLEASGGNGGYSYDWSNSTSGATNDGLTAGSYSVTASDSEGCFVEETFNVTEPPVAFQIENTSVTPIDLGNDGSITLELEGGDPPYSVEWTTPDNQTVNSQNLINLNVPGEYCFVAVDERGCTLTGCVEVLLTLRISNFEIVDACFGEENGSVGITVEGGKEPYSYDWDPMTSTGPSIINEGAGTVTVTVTDDNGETITAEFEIGETDPIDLDYSLIPVTGNASNTNGSISLNVQGGVAPLSYLWDTGATTSEITGLGTGTYCVTITDANFNNNCAVDTCFDMFYSDPLGPPVITTVNTSCSYTEDGAVTIEIPGGVSPFTITLTPLGGGTPIVMGPLSNNIITQDGLAPGSYDVEVVDFLGQTQDDEITVNAPSPITVNAAPDYQNSLAGTCDGSISLDVGGGTPAYTITWSNGGGTGPNPTGLCGDTEYTPTITDTNGCELVGEPVFISNFAVEVASVEDTPCPDDTAGSIDIDVIGGDASYIYIWMNSQGQVIAEVEDVEDLLAGTYTVTVIEGSGREISQTITVETESALALEAQVTSDYNGFGVRCSDSSDGAAQALASGSESYQYEWIRQSDDMLVGVEASIQNLEAGDYQLVVEDELGCTSTTTVSIFGPPALQLQSNIKDIACFDGSNGAIQVIASGGTGNGSYTYNWNTGVFGNQLINIAAGTYQVSVIDNNLCELDTSFTIANPGPISITFDMEPATDGCNGSLTAIVDGGTPPYQYNWMNIDGAMGETVQELCPTINSNAEYLIQVTDANNCLSPLTPAEVDDKRFPCLDERVVITPDGNGTNDEFIIFCVNDYPENSLEVYNRWGGLVFQTENYDNTWEGTDADGNPLPEGPYYYILEYVDPEGNTLQQRGSLTILNDE